MFGKLFKKVTSKEEVMVNSNEEFTVEVDGKELPLKDAIEQIKLNAKNEGKEEAKEEAKCNEVDVDGEKMSLNELVNAYKNLKKASLEKEEEEKKLNEEKKAKEEEEEAKKNSRFNDLDNVHKNGKAEEKIEFLSIRDRVELGRTKYGSKK